MHSSNFASDAEKIVLFMAQISYILYEMFWNDVF